MSIDWPRSVRGECVAACGRALWAFQPPVMARGLSVQNAVLCCQIEKWKPLVVLAKMIAHAQEGRKGR